MDSEGIKAFQEIIDRSRRIVFFGGAGVSTASGIPDFRSAEGLYAEEAAHRKLFELERADKLRGIVTQNVDGLHKAAGNIRVYELHGNVHENYCMECNASYPAEVILESDGIPRCRDCGGVIRPNVVLYGEALPKYVCIGAIREITNADTLIVAGTSLTVEPAASFLSHFRGKNLVVINRDPIPAEEQASLVLRGDVAEIMGQLH